MKPQNENHNSATKPKSSGRHRWIAVVIVVLALGTYWIISSESPYAESLRDRMLSGLGLITEEQYDNSNDGSGSKSGSLPDASGGDNSGDASGSAVNSNSGNGQNSSLGSPSGSAWLDPDDLPEYDGNHYVKVNGGEPAFLADTLTRAGLIYEVHDFGNSGVYSSSAGDEDSSDVGMPGSDGPSSSAQKEIVPVDHMMIQTNGSKAGRIDAGRLTAYEYYGELDSLGRCTVAYGCLGEETMPADGSERGDISKIHPSGWAKAQSWERCHLIAWALSDENANECNLVTGTHYMNHDGMRPLEEEVEHYIWNTGNHVLYMSRPLFSGNELVPRGVQMTAWSVEDKGSGIAFNVYCFNVTPGAEINYTNGVVTTEEQAAQEARQYVINTRSGVFHYPSCEGARSIYKKNRREVTATRKELTDQGYIPCGYCEP